MAEGDAESVSLCSIQSVEISHRLVVCCPERTMRIFLVASLQSVLVHSRAVVETE